MFKNLTVASLFLGAKRNLWLIIFCVLYILLSLKWAIRGGDDFELFLKGSIDFLNHRNIYAANTHGSGYGYYSPFWAFILSPFALFVPWILAKFVWLSFYGILLYRSWILIKSYFDTSLFSVRQEFWWGVLAVFFVMRFIMHNVVHIQMTMLILWGMLEAIALIRDRKFVLGASILAVIISIKIIPATILAYLVYRGYFRACIYTLIGIVICLLLPAFVIGFDANIVLLQQWFANMQPTQLKFLIEPKAIHQALSALVPVFITPTTNEIGLDRHLVSLSVENAIVVTTVIKCFFVVFTLYFLQGVFKPALDKLSEIRAIGYIILMTVMLAPFQQRYAFLMVFPMVVYLTYYAIVTYKYMPTITTKLYIGCLLSIGIILSPLVGTDTLGKELFYKLLHYRAIGVAVLLMVVFAAISQPRKINVLGKKDYK